MTKPRKPRLTRQMADKLRALAGYARANAELLLDSTADDIEHGEEVIAAADWVTQLAMWYEDTHK